MPLLRKPGRAETHADDTRGLLVITSGMSVRFGQSCAHLGIVPARLLRSLGVNGPRLDQWMARLDLAQGLRPRVAPHDGLPPAGIEAGKGRQKGITTHISADAFDVPFAGQSDERLREHAQAA